MHEGTFVGGPVDGLTCEFDDAVKGVLVVDDDGEGDPLAWLYVNVGDGQYQMKLDETADDLTGARPFDEDKAITAAEEGWAVMAVPGELPSQAEIDAEEDLTDGE